MPHQKPHSIPVRLARHFSVEITGTVNSERLNAQFSSSALTSEKNWNDGRWTPKIKSIFSQSILNFKHALYIQNSFVYNFPVSTFQE